MWKRLALAMLGVTVLFNLILLTHMPDSSKAMPRPAENPSRKLGAVEGRARAAPARQGLLKRWILGSTPVAKGGGAGDREASDVHGLGAADGGGSSRSNAEKYLSHPHFSSHRETGNGSALAQQRGRGPDSGAGALGSLSSAEVVAGAGISEQEASELEAVFGEMQETEAGRRKASLSSMPVGGSGEVQGLPDPPGGGSLQGASHAQALMDFGEHPRAPVDPPGI